MKKFTALRQAQTAVHAPEKISAQLKHLGYQHQFTRPLPLRPYLRFHAQFEDGAKISGLIDLSSWASKALPALDGIDWLSMEDRILLPLIAEHRVQLGLSHQHAPFTEVSAFELVASADNTREFPALDTSHGTVLVEQFSPHLDNEISTISSLDHLAVPLSFTLGFSVLPYHAVATIEVGDVLLVEHLEGRISSHGKTLFKTELHHEAIMILEQAENGRDPYERMDSAHPEGLTGLNTLPVELSIVLMEKVIPLNQFKAIIPGETIELPPEAIQNVKILANQRLFADGELVQLANGQLGVEIRTLWPQG